MISELAKASQAVDKFAFDKFALDRWMRRNVPDYCGPITVERFNGGQSNPTYQLLTSSRNYVLRRKPPGEILPGAHAIDREVWVQTSLSKSHVPVPQIYAFCDDATIIGSEFYVMEMLDGRIFWDAELPEIEISQRQYYFEEMIRILANLHSVPYADVGLVNFGKAGGYISRQITRWASQYANDAEEVGRDEDFEFVNGWLRDRLPAEEQSSLIHGDYRLDNVVFHSTRPEIIGVLDWELSTLGDPLADFAYHLMMYRLPPTIIAGLRDVDPGTLGIPTEAEYVQMYRRYTHRDVIEDLNYYIVFNMFRFFAIIHGIKGRAMRGNAASMRADRLIEFLPQLSKIMRDLANES